MSLNYKKFTCSTNYEFSPNGRSSSTPTLTLAFALSVIRAAVAIEDEEQIEADLLNAEVVRSVAILGLLLLGG